MLPCIQLLEFIGDAALVAHNASFDVSFIEQNCRYQDIQPDFTSVDTVAMARILLPTLSKYKLNVVANALHISLENHHRASGDGDYRSRCRSGVYRCEPLY